MKKIIIVQALISAMFLSNVMAQTTDQDLKKEIGIRMTGVSDFDFIYKKQKSENKYTRLRLLTAGLSIGSYNSSLYAGFACGKEKRKLIAKDFYLIKGWEFMGSTSILETTAFSSSIGVGYVLGFQYNISEKFIVNLETIPSLTTSATFSDNVYESVAWDVDLGFSSSSVGLSIMYRF